MLDVFDVHQIRLRGNLRKFDNFLISDSERIAYFPCKNKNVIL